MHARLWLIPPLLAIAAFCAFGLLATFEPGSFLAYRIAYATGLTLSLAACVVTWVWRGKKSG